MKKSHTQKKYSSSDQMASRLLRHEKKEDSIVIKFRAQSSELNQKEGKKRTCS